MDPLLILTAATSVALAIAVWRWMSVSAALDAARAGLAEAENARADAEVLLETLRETPPFDPDALPFPACEFSRDGHPVRVNAAFLAWHGSACGEDGLPARSKALARLRMALARGGDARDGGVLAPLGMTLEGAEGETAAFLVTGWREADGTRAWMVLLPELGGGGDMPALLDGAPVGVAVIDRGGAVRAVNQAATALLGAAKSEILGTPLTRHAYELDQALFQGVLDGGAERVDDAEDEDEDGDGGAVDIRLGAEGQRFAAVAVRDLDDAGGAAGRDARAVYLVDATSRHELEERILQSQKMQAVGQLAGGIAHDFNNLLTAMTGFCDLLLARHRSGDPSFADIMQIKQNANRAASLVRQLLAFSRQQTLIPRVLDVTETLADLSHLLHRLIGDSVDLQISHGRNLKPVKVDQSQLEQVVINLVVNARDAVEQNGQVRMRTYNVTIEAPSRRRGETMPAGDYILIEVSDSGCGIPEENLDRVFEPFFSTKDVGSGTGLGLSTVYGIVKQTGGFIFVDSVVDEGATFSIYLPAFDGEVDRSAEAAADGLVARDLTGAGTIMLVEDEDPVRLFSARALRGKGYQVIEARSGENALALLRDEEKPVDLLVTDVMMPGMDGPTLIREVRETLPDVPVICISGYSEDALRQRISEDEAIHFLPKPFSLKQLAGKVKDVLTV